MLIILFAVMIAIIVFTMRGDFMNDPLLQVIFDYLGLSWCPVKCGFVNSSDCYCINFGDDCSGCYIYEQNRTDIFINFDEGDEPF